MGKVKTYNDGVAWVCKKKKQTRDFTAPINLTSEEDIVKGEKLFFTITSVRVEDMELAEHASRKLTLKIKIPFYPALKKKDKLFIENVLYDIFHIDIAKDKTEMFVFMEEERNFA